MIRFALIAAVALTGGCAVTQEQTASWQETKLENNAAHYSSCKRQVCSLTYVETLQLLEGGDLTGWQGFCD